MEFFIGLTFDPSSIHHTKIESFKKRFDSKFQKGEKLQLTILPPFSIDFQNNDELNNFTEELSDLLDSHLFGLEQISQIEFNGISFSMGKKGVLALTPKISPELFYCQESLYSFLKESGARFKKSKDTTNPLLPIGRFDYPDLMESAIETAKLEFSSPFVINGASFVLFEKVHQQWIIKTNLYDFDSRDHFFFVNELCQNF
ncbi:MAG: hypothetical protein PHY93_07405 [Bacteriovorax sp.]|nr:hypothetical protein [Bacteriovorax sp.]